MRALAQPLGRPRGGRPAGPPADPAHRGGPALITWPSGRALLGAAFGASLVVNLVLAGLLLTRPAVPEHRGRGLDRMVNRIEATLPAEDRPKFRAVLEAERPDYAQELAALRAAGRVVDAAMAREPFDAADLRAALAEWSARWATFNAAFTETMVHAMQAVSPAGRAQIAAARQQGR
ncbi:periplasmic heavy metal sensor [Dankookia sp. GCM10030260]|uniref:periplasmic heavy metal sensor n=1 Tax=Dankookia sp. GCM10030260 TaxID=3273390 RepID=UPI003609729A